VRTYVPEFPDKGVKITTRQLLCHQSGIVHYKNGPVVATQRKYDIEHPFESVILAVRGRVKPARKGRVETGHS
jgi:CubicO group peptidase (beta-lactamase class C family)